MLYIVSTPIGNLQDITLRALEVLKSCDYILAEDTRQSLKLLNHYKIEKQLLSFHEFNESKKENEIIAHLIAGKEIALISDAGTPLIADPGQQLVKRCIAENLPITAIPGPCALIVALTASGFASIPFQFLGFLPRKKNALKDSLLAILNFPGTSICYESPERLLTTLDLFISIEGSRKIAVARELTKKFETIYRGTIIEVKQLLLQSTLKGEIVLLIDGKSSPPTVTISLSDDVIRQRVADYELQDLLSTKEAIAKVAKETNRSKRDIYTIVHCTPPIN